MSVTCVVALDLGGTDLKSALVDEAGGVRGFGRTPARVSEDAEAPFDVMTAAAARLRVTLANPVPAAGLGSPGVIDPRTGALVGRTPNLPCWDSVPLRERLAARLELPVVVDNDANLAALAEHRVGAARGARVSLTVTVGTGVGCGIVVDDRVLRGGAGGAGEIGHLPLGGGSMPCGCEVEGCIEADAAGKGVSAAARAAGLEAADARALFALCAAGDPVARLLAEGMASALGRMIGAAVNLLDPDVVVVAGGVAQAGDALLEPVRAAVRRHALASHTRRLRIVPAALGEQAGVVGAGLLAWDLVRGRLDR